MSDVTPFSFEGREVRTVLIEGRPWFVAADLARELGHANPRQALASHVEPEDKGVHPLDTPSGQQMLSIVNESGLYALTFGSRVEGAKKFRRWVTSEVLPQIRETGRYSPKPMSALETFAAAVEALREQERRTAVLESRQADLEQRFEIIEENHDRYAAVGYASLRKTSTDVQFLNKLGRRAAQIAKRDGVPISKVHSTIWGEVNAWPIEVWDEALEFVSTRS